MKDILMKKIIIVVCALTPALLNTNNVLGMLTKYKFIPTTNNLKLKRFCNKKAEFNYDEIVIQAVTENLHLKKEIFILQRENEELKRTLEFTQTEPGLTDLQHQIAFTGIDRRSNGGKPTNEE